METNNLVTSHNDDMERNDLPELVGRSIDKALDAELALAQRQMEVLSMQADETQALLQSGNLSDEQFDKAMQESAAIRRSMSEASVAHHSATFEIVMGLCTALVFGGLIVKLRAA